MRPATLLLTAALLWAEPAIVTDARSSVSEFGVKDPVTPISLDVQPQPPQSVDFKKEIKCQAVRRDTERKKCPKWPILG